MQQYRVNYPLLIGLLVGTFACSGAVYGIWKFQIERKSGVLISEAEKARQAGDARSAAEYYGQYLSIQDDDAVRLKYAEATADVADQDDATTQDIGKAVQTLDGFFRDPKLGTLPETNPLRLRLVKMYRLFNRYPDALYHLDYLLEQDGANAELQTLKADYLWHSGKYDDALAFYYKLTGYDPASKSFDEKKASAPHDTQIYAGFAELVSTRHNNPELAREIMDQLVEVNPDSAKARLARGQFLVNADKAEAGRVEIDKAYQLQPENADVMIAKAMQDVQAAFEEAREANATPQSEKFDGALKLMESGKKLHADDLRFYQVAADIEFKQSQAATNEEAKKAKYDAALAQIDEGLKKFDPKKAWRLLFSKADLQLNQSDLKGVTETIDDMKRIPDFPTEYTDWYATRIMLSKGEWYRATEELNRLRTKVADSPNSWLLNLRDIDYFLGLSYERQAKYDLARDHYQHVLDIDPENDAALAGKKRVGPYIGQQSPAESDPLQTAIAEELKKPAEQQDWTRVEKLLEQLGKDRKLDDVALALNRAQLLAMRKDFDGATKALEAAYKLSPDNLLIQRLAVQIARVNPQAGPEKALEMWQIVERKFGDQPVLRLDKADILIALKKDDLKLQLASLADGIDRWKPAEQAELLSGLAQRYLALNMIDEARQYWTMSAELQPNELPLRVQLFQLALAVDDDAGMKEAQDKILQIVRDRNDSTWLYTEARRKLAQYRRGQLGKESLDEIRPLVDRALEQRRDWHELYLINAELELLAGRPALALKAFDEAAARGPMNQIALKMYIQLLANAGRLEDAVKQIDRVPESARQTLLGPLYTEILYRTNKVDDALKQAKLAIESDPDNVQNLYSYGHLLLRSSQAPNISDGERQAKIEQAIQSVERVVELQPELRDAWFFLINCHAMLKDLDSAQKTLRDAQLALSGDSLQEFLARSYATLGRWFDAETMYRSFYDGAPDDMARVQMLADFYLGAAYQLPDRYAKATPLINKILRAGADGKIEANDANLLWARRMAARIFAATNDYQNLLKAEQLLNANAQGDQELIQDKLEKAQILAPRPEPASRKHAIALLEEVAKVQPLTEQGEITLGDLYFRIGEWRSYVKQMDKTVARYSKSAAAREAYARRLLAHGDKQSINDAIPQVNKLRELAPNSSAAFELSVRLANKLGRQQQARDLLLKAIPSMDPSKPLTEAETRRLLLFASLLTDLNDLDDAEKIYRDIAARDPSQSYGLAMFLGMHRDVDRCFEYLNQIYQADRIPDILGVALAVVREKRDQVGEKHDAKIAEWLDRGLRENPDGITLLLLQADFSDIQKRYDDSAAIYRKLLARNDLTGMRRAVVLNNLSFLVALAGPSAAGGVDALKLVNEAKDILGPSSDILDTRAVVLISRGQFDQAIADLNDAVTDTPTPSKYFHLVQAYLGKQANRDAVDTWERAEELGLSRESLNRMEHQKYDEVKRRIEQIRGGAAVTQTEPLRRAG